MKSLLLPAAAALLLLSSCQKAVDALINKGLSGKTSVTEAGFTRYTIPKGQHSSDGSAFRTFEGSELAFTVRFDSSAVYTTQVPGNQYDINKLYGFSDNRSNHHSYSARFGWAWHGNALRLYGYVYNAGKVTSKELARIPIGADVSCRLQASGTDYLFTVGTVTERLPRLATTPTATGYRLYPYFGGDEPAPHNVRILIKE